MKKSHMSIIFNATTIIFVVIGLVMMFNGIQFIEAPKGLDVSGVEMLKFYTVDTNILVAISSFFVLMYRIDHLTDRRKRLPVPLMVFKQLSVVGIAITFIVTLVYLAPFGPYGFMNMYINANLFFHLIVPIISIINYVFFERYDNNLSYTWWGLLTMLFYSLYYVINILIHLNKPNVLSYDFYGFTGGNLHNMAFVIILMYGLAAFISISLIQLNIKFSK